MAPDFSLSLVSTDQTSFHFPEYEFAGLQPTVNWWKEQKGKTLPICYKQVHFYLLAVLFYLKHLISLLTYLTL